MQQESEFVSRVEFEELKAELVELKLSRLERGARLLRTYKRMFLALIYCFVAIPLALHAFTIPNTFVAGNPTVAADVNANFTAIANSLTAMEGKSWRLVSEIDVGAGTGAITFTGLNGNADKTYMIFARIVNSSGVDSSYYSNPNNDLSTNYGYQHITVAGFAAPTTGNTGANNSPGLYTCYAVAGSYCEYSATIYAVTGAPRVMIAQNAQSVTLGNVPQLLYASSAWGDSSTNISSMTVNGNAGSIGAGSHFELWARR